MHCQVQMFSPHNFPPKSNRLQIHAPDCDKQMQWSKDLDQIQDQQCFSVEGDELTKGQIFHGPSRCFQLNREMKAQILAEFFSVESIELSYLRN